MNESTESSHLILLLICLALSIAISWSLWTTSGPLVILSLSSTLTLSFLYLVCEELHFLFTMHGTSEQDHDQ